MLLATLASGLSKRSVVFLSSGSKKVGRSNRSLLIVEIPREKVSKDSLFCLLFSFEKSLADDPQNIKLDFTYIWNLKKQSS